MIFSLFYNRSNGGEHISNMNLIKQKIMIDVGKADEYSEKFSDFGMPYYAMTYLYYHPYSNNKDTIIKNIKNNEGFKFLQEKHDTNSKILYIVMAYTKSMSQK